MSNPKQQKQKTPPQKEWRNLIWYFLIVLVVLSVFLSYSSNKPQNHIELSQFLNYLNNLNLI